MSNLSSVDLESFLTADAFSVARKNARVLFSTIYGKNQPDYSRGKYISSSVNESLGLLSASASRTNQLIVNLQEMQTLAKSAAKAGASYDSRNEAYAKLRSLSAGMDVYVEETTTDDGTAILNGADLTLKNSSGVLSQLRLDRLSTYGEGGLGLTEKVAAGKGTVSYSTLTQVRNQNSGLVGLDIAGIASANIQSGKVEPETGSYLLKITYAGSDSSIEMRSTDGTVLSRVDADLSGVGKDRIDLGNGLAVDFDKTNPLEFLGIDKYDFDFNGPTVLYADIDYERIYRQELVVPNSDSLDEASATLTHSNKITSGSGSFFIESAGANIIDEGQLELKNGFYNVKFQLNGADSSAALYDTGGRLVGLKRNLDFSDNGKYSVNFGNGLSFKLQNHDIGSTTGTLRGVVEYKRAEDPADEFDFKGFSVSIEKAIARIEAQQTVIDEIKTKMLYAEQQRSAAIRGSNTSGQISMSSVLSLSLGENSTFGIINGGSNSSAAISNEAALLLFSNATSAMISQGNLRVVQVAQL
jgi:hypothetical protein